MRDNGKDKKKHTTLKKMHYITSDMFFINECALRTQHKTNQPGKMKKKNTIKRTNSTFFFVK